MSSHTGDEACDAVNTRKPPATALPPLIIGFIPERISRRQVTHGSASVNIRESPGETHSERNY